MKNSDKWIEHFKHFFPFEKKYQQAFSTYLPYLLPIIEKNKVFQSDRILDRIILPEKVIKFNVNWLDDKGEIHINRGYRVQMNSTLGPYKGGLRFSPGVDEDSFLFLAFKQTFKNAMTNLPLGSGKGGSDFNPKGKSEREIMRFCQQFMLELHNHIGKITDVPAGDIGVGSREIGYMYGFYRKLNNTFSGTITGKDPEFGGIKLRKEATGFGLVYFLQAMMNEIGLPVKKARVLISGAGNVAIHAAQKILEQNGKVLTLSDSGGCIFHKKGISLKDIEAIESAKAKGKSLEEISKKAKWEYHQDGKPWQFKGNVALPCATENELDESDATKLIENGIKIIAEGANMPCTAEAVKLIHQEKILYGPDIAANSGGVFVSGLEMAQNASLEVWSEEKVDKRLKAVMENIHEQCKKYGKNKDFIHYEKGAVSWSFERVARAMVGQGVI